MKGAIGIAFAAVLYGAFLSVTQVPADEKARQPDKFSLNENLIYIANEFKKKLPIRLIDKTIEEVSASGNTLTIQYRLHDASMLASDNVDKIINAEHLKNSLMHSGCKSRHIRHLLNLGAIYEYRFVTSTGQTYMDFKLDANECDKYMANRK